MKHAIRKIHFIGIGGSGMSGIAEVLINLGYTVSGSDLQVGAATQRLAALAARLRLLASPDYLKARGTPRQPADLLSGHELLGFLHPDHLNHWPLLSAEQGDRFPITPTLRASSGERPEARATSAGAKGRDPCAPLLGCDLCRLTGPSRHTWP